jgi:leader peptidase (prepilin peptidase)/N-methyltransferase
VSAVLVGAFGSLVGSFLNVIIFRVPAGKSIVSPPSACPACGARIRAFDNIPIVSWIMLRGKCRACRTGISIRYPLVELGTALFFGLVTLQFWPGGSTAGPAASAHGVASALVFIAFLYLTAVSVVLALIDIDTHTLPNRVVLPSYLVGVALLGTAAILGSDYGALIRALFGSPAAWASAM